MIYGNRLQPVTYQDEFTEFVTLLNDYQLLNEAGIGLSFKDIGKLISRIISKFIDMIAKFWKECETRIKNLIRSRVVRETDVGDFNSFSNKESDVVDIGTDTTLYFKSGNIVIDGIDYMKEVMSIDVNFSLDELYTLFQYIEESYDKLLMEMRMFDVDQETKDRDFRNFEHKIRRIVEEKNTVENLIRESIVSINPTIKKILNDGETKDEMVSAIRSYEILLYVDGRNTTTISKNEFFSDYKQTEIKAAYDRISNSVHKLINNKYKYINRIDKTMNRIDEKSEKLLKIMNSDSSFVRANNYYSKNKNSSIPAYIFGFFKDVMMGYTEFANTLLTKINTMYAVALRQHKYCYERFQKI